MPKQRQRPSMGSCLLHCWRWIAPQWRLYGAHDDRSARIARSQAGFTLVEVLVVLSIIGLVVGLIGPRVIGYLTDAKLATARIQATTLSSAVELFFIDNGRYPREQEGLQALVSPPPNLKTWNGPYLKGTAVPRDPWGRPYGYALQDGGRSFVITFAGNDRRGGEDDDTQKRFSSTSRALTR